MSVCVWHIMSFIHVFLHLTCTLINTKSMIKKLITCQLKKNNLYTQPHFQFRIISLTSALSHFILKQWFSVNMPLCWRKVFWNEKKRRLNGTVEWVLLAFQRYHQRLMHILSTEYTKSKSIQRPLLFLLITRLLPLSTDESGCTVLYEYWCVWQDGSEAVPFSIVLLICWISLTKQRFLQEQFKSERAGTYSDYL